MVELLDVNTIFFTIWGYPMSYIEFFGTLLNIACVYLVARRNILTWPIGIIATLMFGALFYQIQLYSDVIEQIYFLATGLWGWYLWVRYKQQKENRTIAVRYAANKTRLITVAAIIIGTIVLGYFMSNIHIYWPTLFPQAAAFPYLDALTTVMSFAAQILLVIRIVESWVLWVIVDVIAIWLYAQKEVLFVTVLYIILLIIATRGLFAWRKEAAQ